MGQETDILWNITYTYNIAFDRVGKSDMVEGGGQVSDKDRKNIVPHIRIKFLLQ